VFKKGKKEIFLKTKKNSNFGKNASYNGKPFFKK